MTRSAFRPEPGSSTSEIDSEKTLLRRQMRSRLRARSARARRENGESAARHLRDSGLLESSGELVAFSSLPSEIDAAPSIALAHAEGLSVLLPRMAGPSLEFVRIEPNEVLVEGSHGVLEPRAARPAEHPGSNAMFLIPGLAFDGAGGRLGRGAGYYDRALAGIVSASRSGPILGFGFALQIVDRVPMSTHDVRMHGTLTEEGLRFVPGRSAEHEQEPEGKT